MRLFFAIDLPAEVKAHVAAACDALALDRARWRLVRADALHLTLRFLGEVDASLLPALRAIGSGAVARLPGIPCSLGTLGTFPRGARARILWVGLEDRSAGGDLARLARALEDGVRGAGFAPEERAFAPHVTIARARTPTRPPALPPAAPQASFVARELALVRSHLGPAGSRYELVEAFPMCQDAGGGGP